MPYRDREDRLIYGAWWRQQHQEEKRKYAKEWRRANAEKCRAINRLRYSTIGKRKRIDRQIAIRTWCNSRCSNCGILVNGGDRLDFHHIDSKTKIFNISDGLFHSIEKLWWELDKCVPLCRSCHKKIHNPVRDKSGKYSREKS